MSKKFYRLMATPEENWGPLQYAFVRDAEATLGPHSGSMLLSAPEAGDYLVFGDNGSSSVLSPTSFEKYNGVVYSDMPSLEKLLDDGIVVEVPDDIRELDWTIQARMDALASAIEELEEKLEELEPKMYERRFFFLTQEARDSRHIYNELKPMLDGLYSELEGVRGEMEAKVNVPLREIAELHQERIHASVDDLIFGASSRGAEVLGLKKEFDVERDFSL